MTDARPRRVDAERNREALLDAAAVVLARDAGATLNAIAAEAGVSRATAYRHFADVGSVRDALLAEVQELGRTLLQDTLFQPTPGGRGGVSIDGIVQALRAILPTQSRFTVAIAGEPKQDTGLVETFGPIAAAVLREAQANSELAPTVDPALMADALIALGMYTVRRIHRDGVPVDEAMQVMETFLRGMETSPRPLRGPTD